MSRQSEKEHLLIIRRCATNATDPVQQQELSVSRKDVLIARRLSLVRHILGNVTHQISTRHEHTENKCEHNGGVDLSV